ncbi:MAG TPA: hypothetical protein VKF81_14665, partial [Blastocatellia bacterium]|nr:hypothetical protein [Blastocatellia bacterium]
DFPWLFTPAKADDLNRLRPWLCLIVVRKQQGVTLRTDRNLLLPILEIKTPAVPKDELPDLAESWAWAHAQVNGSQPQQTPLQQSLAGDPALNLSRLLSPRRLDPLTDYFACVVPAFDLGVKAGLGSQVTSDDEKSLKAAWASGAQSPAQIQLPVYYSWQFHTGEGADFEALVNLLKARDPSDFPPEVGKKQIDISQPGFAISPPLAAGSTLELQGALRFPESTVADWPLEPKTRFQGALKKILETPWLAMKNNNVDPLLAPPIYGCWHVGRHLLNAPTTPPVWLDELNLDPRNRSVAALGTAVIQTEQEQLMAAAWEQLGEIQRINQIRRQAQLGRAVNGVYYSKHFSRFSEETLLKVVAPAQSRLVVETVDSSQRKSRAILSQRIAQSALPDRAVSATLRKLTGARSPIATRFQPPGAPPIAIVAGLNRFVSFVLTPRPSVVTLDQVTDSLLGAVADQLKPVVRFDRILTALNTSPKLIDFTIAPENASPKRNLLSFTPPSSSDSPEAALFRAAAIAHQNYLEQASIVPSLAPIAPINMGTTKQPLLQSIDPQRTIKVRVQASLRITGPAEIAGDALEPLLDAPDFPQPMYEALRDLSQDFLLPGLEQVPANTVTLLETNSKFVESFLVGLNVEMNREFLWRNYPTDQRGTFFRQFWDTSAGSGERDIKRIIEWTDQSRLGNNANAGDDLVLLIRGELLRRYPNSVIYAVAAIKNSAGKFDLSPKPEDEKYPLFRGSLNQDVTFLGFALKKEDAIADPGWFFVIQEQPTEPRFGMDVADFSKPLPALTTWNDLSWRHLAATPDALKALTHVSVKTQLGRIDPAEWGRNSAHQAFITLQRPVRIGIHARDMLVKG